MEIFNTITALGVLLLFALTVFALLKRKDETYKDLLREYGLNIAFIITLLTTFGSISYSSLWELPPCPLCWYQRIFMFPLPILFLVAIYKKDAYVWVYTRALAFVGILISAYQALLQTGLFGQSLFCEPGSIESCSIPEIQVFGFVTIPFMALVSFLSVFVLSHFSIKNN